MVHQRKSSLQYSSKRILPENGSYDTLEQLLKTIKSKVDQKPGPVNIETIMKLQNTISHSGMFLGYMAKNTNLLINLFKNKSKVRQLFAEHRAIFRNYAIAAKKRAMKIEKENSNKAQRLFLIKNRNPKSVDEIKMQKCRGQIEKSELPALVLEKYGSIENFPTDPCMQVKLFRPIVFIDLLASGERKMGRLTFQIYTEACPVVALEIIRVFASKNSQALHFPRIFKPLWAECEIFIGSGTLRSSDIKVYDFDALDNGRGAGIISFDYRDIKLFEEGLLPFTISFKPLPLVNGKRIAVGRLIKGQKNLLGLSEYGSINGISMKKIVVTQLGIIDS